MKEKLIKYDTARLIKELGFNEKTLTLYNPRGIVIRNPGYTKNEELVRNYTSAPTQSFLQKWLRKNYNIHIVIRYNTSIYKYECEIYQINKGFECHNSVLLSKKYRKVLEKGLLWALKIVENENK
jgi:hypothetical protein